MKLGRTLRCFEQSVCVLAAAAAFAALPSQAHAFQNPDTFAGDPTRAGGGGRYFTGGPLDSYTCEVCHRSEKTPPVQVLGLPDGTYIPGAQYRVTIDWPDDLQRVALMMEMTDAVGHAIGTWSEPDPATLSAADLCTLTTDTPTGARIIPIGADRAVVSAIDCGQHQTTMSWTAPAVQVGAVTAQPPAAMLNGAILSSNTNGKLAGDSVAAFSRALGVVDPVEAPAPRVGASCATSLPRSSGWGVFALGLLAWLGILRCRVCTRQRVNR